MTARSMTMTVESRSILGYARIRAHVTCMLSRSCSTTIDAEDKWSQLFSHRWVSLLCGLDLTYSVVDEIYIDCKGRKGREEKSYPSSCSLHFHATVHVGKPFLPPITLDKNHTFHTQHPTTPAVPLSTLWCACAQHTRERPAGQATDRRRFHKHGSRLPNETCKEDPRAFRDKTSRFPVAAATATTSAASIRRPEVLQVDR